MYVQSPKYHIKHINQYKFSCTPASNEFTEAAITERLAFKNKLYFNFSTNLLKKNTLLDIMQNAESQE